uniref:Coatomer subunit zeta n=1 Tax=Chromera velia CCMP2878 TaxID=1169474 RepID=A0A0G4EYX7_9ALVE|eukprot:Cvel_14247.t1-p1 / transcript=Cvel_14247.t1 / gene=Cvel_14247 / organism=Chromera_velia_CCMP2878 / gene_product=Coatomer subunit zeta-2, putative / transcript_product=Coatomer subunit zeta-2, putative / location=Cvel_scaffold1005:42749-45765(+) / protein_length=178 / sequence_SO=supercontig / SO=protein_coding / is_pseudo=false
MLAQVLAIVLLDSEGQRIAAKYHQKNEAFSDFVAQQKFEKQLSQKPNRRTNRNEVEVVTIDDFVALFRSSNDVFLYVVGDPAENEVIVLELVNALHQALTNICGGGISKKSLFDNLDSVFLLLDEATDGAVIFETEPGLLQQRVHMSDGDLSVDNLTFNQALASAKEQITKSFLSGGS